MNINKTGINCGRIFTYCLINVSCHEELASGTFKQESAAALMTKSFTESLILSLANIAFSSFLRLKLTYATRSIKYL